MGRSRSHSYSRFSERSASHASGNAETLPFNVSVRFARRLGTNSAAATWAHSVTRQTPESAGRQPERHLLLTLEERDQFAHPVAEDEIPEERSDERERHAEHRQDEVGGGEVQKEHVRDGPHPGVLTQGEDDEGVADDRQQEYRGVQRDLPFPAVPERLQDVGLLLRVRRGRVSRPVVTRVHRRPPFGSSPALQMSPVSCLLPLPVKFIPITERKRLLSLAPVTGNLLPYEGL